ncbi:MAG: hypothetical protein ACK44F_05685 [Roseococcus sp.]
MPRLLHLPLALLLSSLALLAPFALAHAMGLRLEALASAPALVALLVFGVGLGFAGFLWWLAARCFALLRDPATTPAQMAALHELPLALPEGTVRALLALIVGVVGLPLLLFSQSLGLNDAVAGYVNGIIAGVFGYYFGARSTTHEAQAARRLGEALNAELRANEELRAREAAARAEAAAAARPARLAETLGRLERQAGVARIILQRLAPALPPGLIPREAETALAAAEQALAGARSLGEAAEEAPLAAALAGLTGASGPLSALLRAAAPAFPALAGGPLGAVALALGIGWNLGAGAWRRFRARLMEAPFDPALFEPGAITPESAALRLRDAPIFHRLFAARAEEPGFLPALLDAALREDAAQRLWARFPGFASPEEARQGLEEFRAVLLADAVAHDVTPELAGRVAAALQSAPPALRPAPGAPPVLPAPPTPEARAAVEALALLTAELRESHSDPLPLLAELTP